MREFAAFVDYVSRQDVGKGDHHLQLQSKLIDLTEVDFLGRLESFDSDFEHVCQVLGIEGRDARRLNVSATRKPYQDYYDEHLRERVRQIYLKDIQIFGYGF